MTQRGRLIMRHFCGPMPASLYSMFGDIDSYRVARSVSDPIFIHYYFLASNILNQGFYVNMYQILQR